MVCSTAILSSSLALSLLRHSVPPSQSFVYSPYSLNTALSIVHDGASGNTQNELTNLLLNGCAPSDVTDFYSSLAHSISSTNNTEGVSFKSANRFYVDDSISLKNEYQKQMQDKYKVKVKNIDFASAGNAAKTMNDFIEGATNGKIKDMIKADLIDSDTKVILINAIHFLGKWKYQFDPKRTHPGTFYGHSGERMVEFMSDNKHRFRVNYVHHFATALLIPYQDERYNFFCLLPFEYTPLDVAFGNCESNSTLSLEQMRSQLTGEILVDILKEAEPGNSAIRVPKLKIASELDGKEVLSQLGVDDLFTGRADLSKISSTPLFVSAIKHKAVIEMDEKGVEAAAATVIEMTDYSAGPEPIVIDRPFLFGIMRDDDILFLGHEYGVDAMPSLAEILNLLAIIYSDIVEPIFCLLYAYILVRIVTAKSLKFRSEFYVFSIATGAAAITNVLLMWMHKLIDSRIQIYLNRGFFLTCVSMCSHICALAISIGKTLSVSTRFTAICMMHRKDIWEGRVIPVCLIVMFALPTLIYCYFPFCDSVFAPTANGYGYFIGIANPGQLIAKAFATCGYVFFFFTTVPMCFMSVIKLRSERLNASSPNDRLDSNRHEKMLAFYAVVLTTSHMFKSALQSVWFFALVTNKQDIQTTVVSLYLLPNTLSAFAEPVLLLITSPHLRDAVFPWRKARRQTSKQTTVTAVKSSNQGSARQ